LDVCCILVFFYLHHIVSEKHCQKVQNLLIFGQRVERGRGPSIHSGLCAAMSVDVVCVLLENMNSLDWSLSHAAHALQRRAPLPFPNLTAESLPRVTLACAMLSWSDTCKYASDKPLQTKIDALRASCGVTVRHTSNGCRPGCLRLHDFFIGL